MLWVRSAKPICKADLANAGEALGWLLRPSNWASAARALGADAAANPVSAGAWLVGFSVLLLLRWRLVRRFKRLGTLAAGRSDSAFVPTLAAVGVTVLAASALPMLMLLVAWRLAAPSEATAFANAVAGGLLIAAVITWTLGMLIQAFRPHGLAEAHFNWPVDALRSLRRALWVVAVIIPMVFVTAAMEWQTNGAYASSLGRGAFLFTMLALAVFSAKVRATSDVSP